MMDDINDLLNDMMGYLAPKADGKTPIQLATILNRVALAIITKAVYGKDTTAVQDDNEVLTKSLQNALVGVDLLLKDSGFGRLMFWANRETKQRAREGANAARATISEWLFGRIKEIKNDELVPRNMLTTIAQASLTLGHGERIAIDDMTNLFLAGQETTANTLGLAFMELASYPDIVKNVQKEVDDVLGTKNSINYEELSKLEFTTRVIKEALRMYPAFPFHFRDIVTDDYTMDGYHIPKGTIVHVNSFVSQHLPEYFPDPEVFKPERFMDNAVNRHSQYTYFPFLIGPRNCIGQSFAKIEAQMLLAKFLQRFDYKLHPTQRRGFMERTSLTPMDNLTVTITERTL